MAGPLAGIKVVDFGRYIAGPFCAALLADLGAEVIRVEKREGREDRTLVSLADGEDGQPAEGAIFLQCNRNKRSLTLDPMTETGKQITRKLIASADVVVANLPAETLVAMGLDYATVSTVNPRAILAVVSAFGLDGPYARRVGFDGVAQSMCGAAYMTGAEGQPMRSAAPWVDFGTASLLAFGVLAALRARESSGRGDLVEAELLRTALTYFSPTLIEQAVLEIDRKPTLNRGQHSGPSDLFRTKDGWINISVSGEPLFRRIAKVIEAAEWRDEPSLQSDKARGDHGAMISERVQSWCAQRSTAEALAALEAARVPVGPVFTPRQALEDPHVTGGGYFTEIEYPGIGQAVVGATPVTLHALPRGIRNRPPTLGQHSAEVLKELGYTDADIAQFAEQNTI